MNGVANRKILLLSLSRSVSAYYNGLFFFIIVAVVVVVVAVV